MLKLTVYIPETHLDIVKDALFAAGAGRCGNYDCCAWQAPGTGQFRPLAGAAPFTGSTGLVEHVPEYRVEMVCEEARIRHVLAALRAYHPYEEPAFDVVRVLDPGAL